MVGKCIGGKICHTIHRYATVSNKCMANYNTEKESSVLMYWDPNSLYICML